jgi:hypothetical protein
MSSALPKRSRGLTSIGRNSYNSPKPAEEATRTVTVQAEKTAERVSRAA